MPDNSLNEAVLTVADREEIDGDGGLLDFQEVTSFADVVIIGQSGAESGAEWTVQGVSFHCLTASGCSIQSFGLQSVAIAKSISRV